MSEAISEPRRNAQRAQNDRIGSATFVKLPRNGARRCSGKGHRIWNLLWVAGLFFVFTGAKPLPKTLILPAGAEPKSFNLLIAQETSTSDVIGFLFEGLTRFNPRNGEIEPLLAERWTHSEDGRVWTFFLREDVRWFDGASFTSKDVLFTFKNLIYNPKIITSARDIFLIDGKEIEVEALNEYTVRFTLPDVFAPFLYTLTQPMFPGHVLKKSVDANRFQTVWGTDTDPKEIIGTGPFRLRRYVPGERVELERNPLYWKRGPSGEALPYLERVIFVILPSPELALLKFLQGEIDYLSLRGIDYPLLKPKEAEKNFFVNQVGPSMGSSFLVFNQNHGLNPQTDKLYVKEEKLRWFTNPIFRKAVAHAIDRRAIIDIVFQGLGEEQCSSMSPSAGFFYNDQAKCYEYDPGIARALLEKQGFRDRDGDGIREDQNGVRIEFTLVTNADNSQRVQIAGMIREDLARIGFRVHFLPLEFNQLVSKLTASYDWEACLIGLTGDIEPHFGANVWRSNGSLHFWNPGQKDPATEWEARVDALFSNGLKELDHGKRKSFYDEWQLLVQENLPLIYTVLPEAIFAVRNRFGNLQPTPLGGVFYNIEEIYAIEPDSPPL